MSIANTHAGARINTSTKEKRLPFAAHVPGAETQAAMEESRLMMHARFANAQELLDAIEKEIE